jgi:hypothetical protein
MSRPDIQITFQGLELDRSSRIEIDQVAEQIFFLAPSDSLMSLNFYKTKKKASPGVRLTGRIASTSGLFLAEAYGPSPLDALASVQLQLTQQFQVWRKKRFTHINSQDRAS